MQPVGAQAGSQAVVDGRVLAAALMASADPVEALVRYHDHGLCYMRRRFASHKLSLAQYELIPSSRVSKILVANSIHILWN